MPKILKIADRVKAFLRLVIFIKEQPAVFSALNGKIVQPAGIVRSAPECDRFDFIFVFAQYLEKFLKYLRMPLILLKGDPVVHFVVVAGEI